MRAEEHMAKSRRLEASVIRNLDHIDDYELVIWGCIHGGAQLLNVVFHVDGFTPDGDDMIHTFVPELDRPVPLARRDFMATLARIEALGPRFVRGCEPWNPDVAARCLEDLRILKAAAEATLAGA